MRSQARRDAEAHMLAVKSLGCLICGAPAEVHHLPHPRDDMRTIALCPRHHRTEFGEQAYHYNRKRFNDTHGSDKYLLEKTMKMLDK